MYVEFDVVVTLTILKRLPQEKTPGVESYTKLPSQDMQLLEQDQYASMDTHTLSKMNIYAQMEDTSVKSVKSNNKETDEQLGGKSERTSTSRLVEFLP